MALALARLGALPCSHLPCPVQHLLILPYAPGGCAYESFVNKPKPIMPLSTATSASFRLASSSPAVFERYCDLILRARETWRCSTDRARGEEGGKNGVSYSVGGRGQWELRGVEGRKRGGRNVPPWCGASIPSNPPLLGYIARVCPLLRNTSGSLRVEGCAS